MLPVGSGPRCSAGLGNLRVGLGLLDPALKQRALELGHEAEGLGGGQIALAGLAGCVGVRGEAFERGGLGWAGGGYVLPGVRRRPVVAEVLIAARGEDRDRRIGLADEGLVALVVLAECGQLLLAGGGELAGGGVDVGAA